MVEAAEGVAVAGVAHVSDLVGAQDVGGEAADAGQDAWVYAHPAGIFGHGAVSGVVEAVLDAPMAADGGGGELRCRLDVGDIVGGLAGGFPKAGFGAALEAVSLHTDDAGDDALPAASLQGVGDLEDLGDACFVARAGLVIEALVALAGRFIPAQPLDARQQARLVRFDLGNQLAPLLGGALEGFFDSAWHRR